MKHLSDIYQKVAVYVLNTLLLFIFINLIAFLIKGPISRGREVPSIITNRQMLEQNPALMQKIYGGKSPEVISALIGEAPNLKSHPTLQFMIPPQNSQFYHTGMEGCRYDDYVTDSNVASLINGGRWLLGGSTAFGFGLPGNETLGHFLNQLDSGNHWINFATLNYHQQLELEKLILLLKKGYRPSKVVLLDGLNDLFQLTASHFDASEIPGRTFHAYSQEFNIEQLHYKWNLVYALPVVRLFYEYKAEQLVKRNGVGMLPAENIYEATSLYNTNPYLHYLASEIAELPVTPALLQKTSLYYTRNLALLDTLSKAYGFEYAVFYQPNGVLFNQNIFVTSPQRLAAELHNYKAMQAMHQYTRLLLAQNKISHFFDLSEIHAQCPTPYVDLTHYSCPMNQFIAQQILERLKTSNSADNELRN